MSSIEIFKTIPHGFNTKIQVAASYVLVEDKLLILQLSPAKQEAGAWGVPAGKLEVNESPAAGACRELYEETGIFIELAAHMHPMSQLYIRKPKVDYVYHIFGVKLNHNPKIQLSHEHSDYRWVTPQEVKGLPLMKGAQEALEMYYQRLKETEA